MALVDNTAGNLIRALIAMHKKDLDERESKMQQAIDSGADHFDEPDMRELRVSKLIRQLERLDASDSPVHIGGEAERGFSVNWCNRETGKPWMFGAMFLSNDGKDPGVNT